MQIPQKYFHDRVVLALLAVALFLAMLSVVIILFLYDGSKTTGYFIRYRPSLGLDRYNVTGGFTDVLALGVFNFIVITINTLISMRLYHVRRQLSITVLGMSILLIVLSIIVSNLILTR